MVLTVASHTEDLFKFTGAGPPPTLPQWAGVEQFQFWSPIPQDIVETLNFQSPPG